MTNTKQIPISNTSPIKRTTTRPLRPAASGAQSEFHSAAQTSGHTSDGLFLPLLLALLCLPLAVPLLLSTGLYEWFRDLRIQEQFRVVAGFCSSALVYAATVREFCREPLAQWSGRIAGAAGFMFLLAFAWKASVLCASVTEDDRVERHYSEQQIVSRERNR